MSCEVSLLIFSLLYKVPFGGASGLNNSRANLDGNRYSERVARWCESKMGKRVGNGECWTLAREALLAISDACEKRGVEPCFVTQGSRHGQLIYDYTASDSSRLPSMTQAGVARGDIIQFHKAYFYKGGVHRQVGAPSHTSVVTENRGRGVIEVVEQNGAGGKVVSRGSFDFKAMKKGNVRIFRVVGIGAGPATLDTRW